MTACLFLTKTSWELQYPCTAWKIRPIILLAGQSLGFLELTNVGMDKLPEILAFYFTALKDGLLCVLTVCLIVVHFTNRIFPLIEQ